MRLLTGDVKGFPFFRLASKALGYLVVHAA